MTEGIRRGWKKGQDKGGEEGGEVSEVKEPTIFWSRPWIQKPLGYGKIRNDWPHRVKLVMVNRT